MTVAAGLCLDRIIARYGCRTAVDGLTLQVRPGEIVGLLGPNGSGKSTTLAVAAGLHLPAFGAVSLDGIHQHNNPHQYAYRVGFVPQDPALYDDLTAFGNLAFFARLYGYRGRDLAERVQQGLVRAQLQDRANARVGTFSGGMKQRLNLAAALLHDPTLVLLDEPTAALDPASREALYADLAKLREDGRAVLLTTHHWDEAEMGCDRIVVLEAGVPVASGTAAEVLRAKNHHQQHLLYGHLSQWVTPETILSLQDQLEPGWELEITGRRVRLSAQDSTGLGRALAMILSAGLCVETFRTPPARLTVRHNRTPAEAYL